MSDLPIPKYRIGDTVYRGTITSTTEKLPCPDCLGEKVWHATTPAGITHLLECPRCQDRYSLAADKLPSLQVQRWVASVNEVTIGSIEAKTHDTWDRGSRVTYMTSNTGSGSIYYERDLHSTREAALAVAEAQAALKNAEVDRSAIVLTARRFASLPLADALHAKVRDNLFEAWAAFRSMAYMLTDLLPEDQNDDDRTKISASDLRTEIDRIERGRVEYPSTYPRHPIDVLLMAIESGGDVAAAVAALKAAATIAEKD